MKPIPPEPAIAATMPQLPPNLPRPAAARRRPDRRGSTTARGYGWEHQRQRAELLAAHPLCQRCRQRWATDLHHRDGNPFNRSPDNAEAVCEACHHGGEIHGA